VTATSRSPWLPMGVVMAATIMVALDSTVVNVALHRIGGDLDAGSGIEWVVTAYLLGLCASQPATGWLADRFGRKPVFLTSLVAFTVASLLCGLAPNLGLLVFARVLQGLGGGALMPVGMAIALELFPPERRGRAMAMWGVATMAAPAIGPTAGGWLIEAVSWHWLFFINIPIGVGVLLTGLRLLHDSGPVERRPFDLPGLLYGGSGLSLFVLGVSQGSQWGWGSGATFACLAGGVAQLVAFVRHEQLVEHPLIDLSMFSVGTFRVAMLTMMAIAVAQYARFVFMPLQLQSLRGYSALDVGLLFMPAAISAALGMQIGGRLVDAIGARRPVVFGAAGVAVTTLGFWRLQLDTPVGVIIGLMCLQGLSWGVTTSPTLVAGLSELPTRLIAQASAVRSLAHHVAAALGVAVLGAVASTRMGDDPSTGQAWSAYSTVYLVGFAATAAAAVLALKLPDRADRLHHEPAEEPAVALLLD